MARIDEPEFERLHAEIRDKNTLSLSLSLSLSLYLVNFCIRRVSLMFNEG